MNIRHFCFLLFSFLFLSCQRKQPKVLVLQPFQGFPEQASQQLLSNLNKCLPFVVLKQAIPFPPSAYVTSRNRYRADSLIRFLRDSRAGDTLIVGLSADDISTTKGQYKDWGVMGLGYRPGKACVVSTFRLRKANLEKQFYKLVLHEIGHTQGLKHCEVPTCFMRDAEGGNPIDEETDFCTACKQKLHNAGWKMSFK